VIGNLEILSGRGKKEYAKEAQAVAARFGAFLGLLAVGMLIAGCAISPEGLGDSSATHPGDAGSAATKRSAGFTWMPGCALTSEEVQAALGRPVSAPQLPEQPPVKAGLLQSCGFVIVGGSGTDGLGINVFDAGADATSWLDSLSSGFPNGVNVPGIGDAAFMGDQPRAHDLWAVNGQTELHIFVSPRLDPLTVEQFKALANAAFGRL
jgi:hypothetical protein